MATEPVTVTGELKFVSPEYAGQIISRIHQLEKLLTRYLDNHCSASDQEGMSTLCECQLCLDTRTALNG